MISNNVEPKQPDTPGTYQYSLLYPAGTGLDCGGRTGGAGPSSLYLTAPGPLSATRRVRTSAAASGDFVGETANTAAVRSVSTTGTKKLMRKKYKLRIIHVYLQII